MITSLINIRKMDIRYLSIFIIMPILILLYFLTLLFPGVILYDFSLALLCYIMYFTIENPDLQMVEQLELAKNQAEKSNRAKSDFLSSMSHEIRTPLNAIVGFSEDIQTHINDAPPEVVEDANYILEASQTLLEIVGNILDINKIEAQKLEIINSPYNFKEEVTKLCNVTKSRIGDKNIVFNLNIDSNIPNSLIGDSVKVKQIINNLLTNAIKYTNEGSINLDINCNIDNNICNITIICKDTGIGISEENLTKLFNKFERLDTEKNSTIEGTGLGLAITKSIVEMMGGTIDVESKLDEGSTFIVKIPQNIDNNVEEVVSEIKEDTTNYGIKKVLIVDDNKLNIMVAKKALDGFNFELDECTNGVECLEKVISKNFDLIIMDIMMPEMDGEETLKQLKEIDGFNTPVLAVTADAVDGAKEKYVSEGFIDYIPKPFTKGQIKEKLDIVFKSKYDTV